MSDLEMDHKLHLGEIPNADWVCSCFMVPTDGEWVMEERRRYHTLADNKIGDASLGGGRVLNTPPGICEFADTPRGRDSTGQANTGLGVFAAEMLDEQLDVIHIRPGVPRFNSLIQFYTNAVQEAPADGNERGWFDGMVHGVSKLVGYVLTIPIGVAMSPFHLIKGLISNDNTNRYGYYYLEPAAMTFWMALDNAVNNLAVRMGVIPTARYTGAYEDGGRQTKVPNAAAMAQFAKYLPGVYIDSATAYPRIDTLAIGCRYSIIEARRQEALTRSFDSKSGVIDDDYLSAWEKHVVEYNPWNDYPELGSDRATDNIHKEFLGISSTMKGVYSDMMSNTVEFGKDENDNPTSSSVADDYDAFPEAKNDGFGERFSAIVSGGADFISLAVDRIEETSVTITNTAGPSGIESSINGAAKMARGVKFSAMGGNLSDNPIMEGIEGLLNTGAAAIGGFANGVIGGAPAAILGGKAFIDIADVYQESTMEFNALSYSLTSVSTSGHPLAKLKMYLPYLALLVLTAPRSAGPASFGSPFLVEVHHKGKGIVELGMIGSLKATFGEGDAWDINDIANILKIDFDIINLNKGFHVPVDPGASLTYRETGAFELHIGTLAGRSLTEQDKSLMYNLKRTAINLSQTLDKYTSPATWGHALGDVTKRTLGGTITPFLYTNRR